MLFTVRYLIHPETKEKYLDTDYISLSPVSIEDPPWKYRLSQSEAWIPINDRYIGYVSRKVEIGTIQRKPRKGEEVVNLVRLSDTNIVLLPLARSKKKERRNIRCHCFFPKALLDDFDIPTGTKLYHLFKLGLDQESLIDCPYKKIWKNIEERTFGITQSDKDRLEKFRLEGESTSSLILRVIYSGLVR